MNSLPNLGIFDLLIEVQQAQAIAAHRGYLCREEKRDSSR